MLRGLHSVTGYDLRLTSIPAFKQRRAAFRCLHDTAALIPSSSTCIGNAVANIDRQRRLRPQSTSRSTFDNSSCHHRRSCVFGVAAPSLCMDLCINTTEVHGLWNSLPPDVTKSTSLPSHAATEDVAVQMFTR